MNSVFVWIGSEDRSTGRQGSQMAGMMGYDTRAFDTALELFLKQAQQFVSF